MLSTAANDRVQVDVPRSAYSLAGFRQWVASSSFPESGRLTYFQGEVFLDMSPERARSHNKVKSEICRVLGNLVVDHDLGELYQDGMWLTNDEADLSSEADGMFVSWKALEHGQIQLISTEPDGDGIEMRGSPDWVLEVVSDSSVRKDTQWLRSAYHRAKVREFWIVDARGGSILFSILAWNTDAFKPAQISSDGWQRSEVFDRSFKLERQRDRIGGWKYSLHFC